MHREPIDIDDIIDQVITALHRESRGVVRPQRAYVEEPIITRGSRMPGYLPEPLRRLRDLERSPEAAEWSSARLFVEQARLVSDYEETTPFYADIKDYCPTYARMSNRQLRAYFWWRTQTRHGDVATEPAAFGRLFIFEMLNGIWATPGLAGFRAIETFGDIWYRYDDFVDRHLPSWLIDYVIYYGLDTRLVERFAYIGHDHTVATLKREQDSVLAIESQDGSGRSRRQPYPFGSNDKLEKQILSSLDEVSTYHIKKSRLFRDAPDDVRAVCRAVFDRLAIYYDKNRSLSLIETLFGEVLESYHPMFAPAPFDDAGEPHPDTDVWLSELEVYRCRYGWWTRESLCDQGKRSAKLGQVLRVIDRVLREALGHPNPLKDRGEPKYLVGIVRREVADYLEWKQEHVAARVEIDLSKLEGIRTTAAATRETLLVDEEREDAGSKEAPVAETVPAAEAVTTDKGVLSGEERTFVEDLLAGRPCESDTDLMVDAINDKLLDLVGDTVLEFDEDGRAGVVEDYREDLLGLL